MENIALELFGTTDIDGVLAVLSPSDALVREYNRRVKEFNAFKGASTCQTQKIKSPKH